MAAGSLVVRQRTLVGCMKIKRVILDTGSSDGGERRSANIEATPHIHTDHLRLSQYTDHLWTCESLAGVATSDARLNHR
jgi:hypothetical protein